MKTLFLLRHAKSSWKDATLKDFDRPLNKRGLKDIKIIGKFIRRKSISPSLIISSTAERARLTAELLLKSSGLKVELRFDERIYEASVDRLLEVISEVEETCTEVMLIGHNPGFENLHSSLTGMTSPLPTAGLACIELSVDKWSRVRPGTGRTKLFVTPKVLDQFKS
jgi:phosphohistidine phosphatase